jgi:hypothetical protein
MTMPYAHLSPAFLSAEVSLLDPPPKRAKGKKAKRARKGQRGYKADHLASEAREFVRKSGSSGWTRTSNPPVNRSAPEYRPSKTDDDENGENQ